MKSVGLNFESVDIDPLSIEVPEKLEPPPASVTERLDVSPTPSIPFELLSGEKVLLRQSGSPIGVGVKSFICISSAVFIPSDFYMTSYRIFAFTEYKLYLRENKIREDYFDIPLMMIQKIDRQAEKSYILIDIHCKDGRFLKMAFDHNTHHNFNVYTRLISQTFPQSLISRFPFSHTYEGSGWTLYNIREDMTRLNLLGEMWCILDNSSYSLCDTYPPYFMGPRSLLPTEIRACAGFRARNRLPALVWGDCRATLWRSSQPKTGLRVARSEEDEKYLKLIAESSSSFSMLHIFDARGYIAAQAQRALGGGVENPAYYENTEVHFLRISNVHSIRESWQGMLSAGVSTKYLSVIEKSGWLELLGLILEGSVSVVKCIQSMSSVLVHCTDGWDRTAQICSIVEICLDPHYRTLRGFCELVEKEWVLFGHQFDLRLGHANPNSNNDKFSPIFIQFLDCVRQLLVQFPISFEFSETFLYELAVISFSCRFGTFMCNSAKQRESAGLQMKTPSAWSYLFERAKDFTNPYYQHGIYEELIPCFTVKRMQIWHALFSRWHPDFYYPYANSTEEHKEELMKKLTEEIEYYREKIVRLEEKNGLIKKSN